MLLKSGHSLDLLWTDDSPHLFGAIMSRSRFVFLQSNLAFDDEVYRGRLTDLPVYGHEKHVLSTVQPLLGVTKDDGKQKPVIIYDFTKLGTDIVD